jgi:hypothetical protein
LIKNPEQQMSQPYLRNTLRAAALAVVATVGGVGAANAAVVTGSWDPAFGSALPHLGFAGSATFYVPDACLTGAHNPGSYIKDSAACSGGGMSLLSAHVDLYDLSAPAAILQTLVYATQTSPTTSNLTDLNLDPVLGVYVKYDAAIGKNEVLGASTGYIGPQASNLAIANHDSFYLKFDPSGSASLFIATCSFSQHEGNGEGRRSEGDDDGGQLSCQPDLGSGQSSLTGVTFAPVIYAPVPEPGSLALVLAAMVAGGAARRVRRQGSDAA